MNPTPFLITLVDFVTITGEVISVLDNKSYKLLKKLYKKKKLNFEQAEKITHHNESKSSSKYISSLSKSHFITNWYSDEIINDIGDMKQEGYSITLEGEAYVEQRRRDRRMFWVPYLITTAIALLSLITSLVEHWETIINLFCD